jgi:3-hydroxymyristoyl/3-hydroxydecanoyl-(acyl carrier protein) dehydratase
MGTSLSGLRDYTPRTRVDFTFPIASIKSERPSLAPPWKDPGLLRFNLVDTITAWHPGVRAEGLKAATRTDDFMAQTAVFPRTLLIESLAQLSSFLLGDSEAREGRRVLSLMTSLDKMTWHGDLQPGERATLLVEIMTRRPEGARLAVSARAGDRPLADGRLGFVFFAAESEQQAQEFAWTYELLLQLAAPCTIGDPPRRQVLA